MNAIDQSAEPLAPGFHALAARIRAEHAAVQAAEKAADKAGEEKHAIECGALLASAQVPLGDRFSIFLRELCPEIPEPLATGWMVLFDWDRKHKKAAADEDAKPAEAISPSDAASSKNEPQPEQLEQLEPEKAGAPCESRTELLRYDAMCRAIDAAYEVDELQGIRDQAKLFEAASRLAHNTKAERRACEIRLRAERKAGQLLTVAEKAKGARGSGSNQHKVVWSHHATAPRLRDHNITKQQSSDWQKLASVPQEEFDTAIAEAEKPTTKGILRATQPAKPKAPVSSDALWLWGRLNDFEKMLLDRSPEDVMGTMTDQMKDDVHAKAPRVARWLKTIGSTKCPKSARNSTSSFHQ